MMITGPNDARRIVWALGEFFYYFLCVFFWYLTIYIGTTDSLKVWCGSTQATTTTTGTKTRHLGLGECFLLLFIVFIILITIVNRFWNDGTQMTVTLLFGPRYHHHTTTPYQHHTIPTTPAAAAAAGTPSHQHKQRLAGGDEGSRLARLNPLTVCVFFFLFSLTILISIYTYSYNYGTSTSTSTSTHRHQQPATTTIITRTNGPDDASRDIWAIPECFFY